MSNPLSALMIRLGLVRPSSIEESQSWGLFYDVDTEKTVKIDDPVSIGEILEEALQSEGLVLTRTTDLDAIQQYLQTQQVGKLQFESPEGESISFETSFGRDKLGEFILPYRAESITELMTAPTTALTYQHQDGSSRMVTFQTVRELFYGQQKAFLLCHGVEGLLHPEAPR